MIALAVIVGKLKDEDNGDYAQYEVGPFRVVLCVSTVKNCVQF